MGQNGFTLIEILIVVAILALLAAILFPVFSRARENARRTSCASNLRQLATAATMYSQDYDERTVPGFIRYAPPPDFASFARWTELLQPYLKNRQVNVCPSASDLSTRAGGYGINKNLSGYADPSFTTGATRSLSEVTDAAGTAFIVDAAQCAGEVAAEQNAQNWNGYVTGPTDWQWTPPGAWDSAAPTGRYTDNCSGDENDCRRPVPRHFDGLNVAYSDGHVKWTRIERLLGTLPNGWNYGHPLNSWDNR
jgi:prepilin-type N-terminal cleavage/methylation domain-containing protein/prepilin-type processing-associated H-X9-DG protein